MVDERSRRAVEVAERYADAQATGEELETALDAACAVWDADMKQASAGGRDGERLGHTFPSLAAYNVAIPVRWWGAAPAFVAPYEVAREATANSEGENAAQGVLLRDIFGNPFRAISLGPAILHRNSRTISKLAEAIYHERAFDRLPILANALEEAECLDDKVLSHCRQPNLHVRGCWVVDLVLGKE
jgi:hypothetical protein